MDRMQTGIIALLKSAITGNSVPLSESFDIDAAYSIIKAHHIAPLVYTGALNCGIDHNQSAMQQLFQSYVRAIQLSQQQMKELERVFKAFHEAGIDYLPLKGCVMKAFYPQPELRLMGDADVLIRVEQYDRIVPVMKMLGFTEQKGTEYHFVWVSDYLDLELHRYLVKSDFKKCHDYFQNGWMHAVAKDGTRYAMDDVNTFAFLFAHFAKHYASEGIGCRHVVDLWVYLRKHPQMDQAKLRAVLEEMELWRFYQNIRKLIGVWFEGEASDEKTEFISQMILANGSWGDAASAVLNEGAQDMEKTESVAVIRVKYIWSRLFPSVVRMKSEYPILRERPWLLPAMWIMRTYEKTIKKRSNMTRHMKRMILLNKNELRAHMEMLEYVGLSADEQSDAHRSASDE